MSYSDHIYSEIRRRDRRAVRSDHLLYVHKKCQLMQLSSNINIALKKSAQSQGVTANQALDKSFIEATIGNDNAFRFLTNITGSPSYWQQQKKNVLAMVRQHGIFTFFVTLSAAESHWIELLKILKKTVDYDDDADVSNLDFEEKSRLIREDPVTCALYFNYKFKELKKTWYDTLEGPFGEYKVVQSYYRIEFQHRGSPHVHLVVWLEGAPKFDAHNPHTFEAVVSFVDKFISTSSDDTEVQDFLKYQYHKCTHTCRKTTRGIISCRFGAPFFPMSETCILQPVPEDLKMTKEEMDKNRNLIGRLNELLDNKKITIDNFDDMLLKLKCTKNEYLFAVRTQLKASKIFLKRSPKDCRINPYSKKILTLMQSNIDIQYVLDPYACITYIVDYINKPARGISKLLRSCVENFKDGNHSIREKLKTVSNAFYNGTEISAQEAAWCRLRLPMSCSSVAVEFINTGPRKVIDLFFYNFFVLHSSPFLVTPSNAQITQRIKRVGSRK